MVSSEENLKEQDKINAELELRRLKEETKLLSTAKNKFSFSFKDIPYLLLAVFFVGCVYFGLIESKSPALALVFGGLLMLVIFQGARIRQFVRL